MASCEAPRVVLLTPLGRGAIATILVDGLDAAELVGGFFHSSRSVPLEQQPIGRILYGRWGSSDGEELVVCRLSATRVEIHCHGGSAATTAVITSLCERGGEVVEWRDWLPLSEPDPIGAAAIAALAEARTERTAAILLDQYHGALRQSIQQARMALRDNNAVATGEILQSLLAFASLGLHLVKPWRVVIAGPPNVGKSTLINALLGYQRAIVYDQPGTTRDVVTATTAFDGWPVELSDTAGLRQTDDPIEIAGVGLTRQRLADTDLIVLVFDTSQPWTPQHADVHRAWQKAIVLHNKCDLVEAPIDRPLGLRVSALTSTGVENLIREITSRLVPNIPLPGAPVPFTHHQIATLEQALAAAKSVDLPATEKLLQTLLPPLGE